ncbi:MAG: winged helix-turn-helix transcriptional regulator [Spirochaetales bacterium]|nr:winged helix-turn-helix transcriptional regulator [Spirochaetales bacterium]
MVKTKDYCRINEVIEEEMTSNIPVDEEIMDLADFFKVFGDPTRLKILSLLEHRELCVHDLAAIMDMQQTAISHQLKSLRQARLVRYRREGKMALYSLSDSHIKEIFSTGLEHIKE